MGVTVIFQGLFWFCVSIVVYVYFGYPLLLFILSKLRPAPPVQKADIIPTVSLIIAAYNEEKVIDRKLENCLALDYPRDKLEIIVVSDGSVDGTNQIVRGFASRGVKLVALNSNGGKSHAENKAVAQACGDILLFTDADIMLRTDVAKRLIENFADQSVGCVVGKIVYKNITDTSVSRGEGAYWQYELFLREKESKLGNFAMGSGIMALRHKLFRLLDPNVGEDFVLPMRTAMAGYRVIYEPEGFSDTVLHQTKAVDMLRSKVRVISKDLRGVFQCRGLLNPLRYPLYAWGLISHKLLRWLMPYLLITLYVISLILIDHSFYRFFLVVQTAFYILALFGYVWQRKGQPPRIPAIPFSFCLVNMAAFIGVAKFAAGKKSGQWKPVRN